MFLDKFSLKTRNFTILQRMYGSLTFLQPSNFAVLDDWYFLQYCSLRIAQIALVNQLYANEAEKETLRSAKIRLFIIKAKRTNTEYMHFYFLVFLHFISLLFS